MEMHKLTTNFMSTRTSCAQRVEQEITLKSYRTCIANQPSVILVSSEIEINFLHITNPQKHNIYVYITNSVLIFHMHTFHCRYFIYNQNIDCACYLYLEWPEVIA